MKRLLLFAVLLLTPGVLAAAARIHIQAVAADAHGDIWAGTFGQGLFRSTDAGISFKEVLLPKSAGRRILAVATDGSTVVIGTESTGVFVRGSAGGVFEPAVGIPASASSEAIWVSPEGKWWAGTWDDGLFVSEDGRSFEPVEAFQSSGSAAAIIGVGSRVFIGTTGDGLYLSMDNGQLWEKVEGIPPQSNVAVLREVEGKSLLVGMSEGWLYRSDDLRSFRRLGRCVPAGATLYQVEVGADRWVASSSRGLFDSRDHGVTWAPTKGVSGRFTGMVLRRNAQGAVAVIGQAEQPAKR